MMQYNVYCDESCHLLNDNIPVMLIGSIWCPKSKVKEISYEIEQVKREYKCCGELKWTKVSDSRLEFFRKIIQFFFSYSDLNFRCLIIRNKEHLDHLTFNQGSHDTFYYKMYFSMLKAVLSPVNTYDIFLDIKDTRSNLKVRKLRDILCNNVYDFTGQMITKIQQVRSNESRILQIADLLIGAISYKNRGLNSSNAKMTIVEDIKAYSGKTLTDPTSLFETKFNLFFFTPSPGQTEECHE